MLSLLLDIKNNRQRGGGGGPVALTGGTTKWLKSVGAPSVALHNLSWDKLLAPNHKVCPLLYCTHAFMPQCRCAVCGPARRVPRRMSSA